MTTPAANAALDALRGRVRALEFGAPGAASALETVSLGVAALDEALPWGGLPRGALHEVAGAGDGGAEGFCAALAARLIDGRGPVLWCLARGDLHGPGLGVFGLDPDRLIVARTRGPRDVLWAMEEGLRSGLPGAVLGEPRVLDLTAGRRLQLAARAGGVACLVLHADAAPNGTSVALTRWRVAAAPSRPPDGLPGLGAARWRVALERCRGGVPREWLLEWNDEARHLVVVPLLAERTAGPAAAQAVG
jgi:protein ImuA